MKLSRLLLSFFVTLISFSSYSQLSGSYTIDSSLATSGRNFQSFSDFESTLTSLGISSPIVVNVVPNSGPYIEQVLFHPFTGSSSVNTVTINGNGENIHFVAPSSMFREKRIIGFFDGASNFIIDSLFVTGIGGVGIGLGDNVQNVTIRNCVFNIKSSGNSHDTYGIASVNCPLMCFFGSTASNLIIENNNFYGDANNGTYSAVFLTGGGPGNSIIRNNNVKGFSYRGIVANNQVAITISNNKISRPLRRIDGGDVGGIEVYNTQNMSYALIENNEIFDLNAGVIGAARFDTWGIKIRGNSLANNLTKVQNNIIHDLSFTRANVRGIITENVSNIVLTNNNILINESASYNSVGSSIGVNCVGTNNNLQVINNIISIARSNRGSNFGISIQNFSSTLQVDFNNVILNSSNASDFYGKIGNNNYPLLSDWQQPYGNIFGANSYSINPMFKSPTNYKPGPERLNNTGLAVGLVSDFLGNYRDTTPDIGAIEFGCGFPELDFEILSRTSVKVKLKQPYDSTLTYEIEFDTIAFNAGSGTNFRIFGSDSIILTNLHYNKNYQLYSRSLCGVNDSSNWSGKLSFRTIGLPLAGAYTIDSSRATGGRNFQSFVDFANTINVGGVSDSVIVEVVKGSGPYHQKAQFKNFNGLSPNSPLIINGNGETIIDSSDVINKGIVEITDLNYITIDSLNIINLGKNHSYGVYLKNYCNFITISNCLIDLGAVDIPYNPSSGIISTPLNSTDSSSSNLTIINNRIIGSSNKCAYHGIYLNNNQNGGGRGNRIANNSIESFLNSGITAINQNNLIIEKNSIKSVTATSQHQNGIFIGGNFTKNVRIEQNLISKFNNIQRFSRLSGISIKTPNTTVGEPIIIQNNIIRDLSFNGDVTSFYIDNSENVKIFNNTSYVNDSTSNSGDYVMLYLTGITQTATLENNLFYLNKSGNGASKMIFSWYSSFNSNNNSFFFGSRTVGTKYIADLNSFNYKYPTLLDWQNSFANKFDQNSIYTDPQFKSTSNLTPQNNLLRGAGVNRGVLDDFNNNLRDTIPDIGAINLDSINYPYYPIQTIVSADSASGVADSLNTNCYISGTVASINFDGVLGYDFYLIDQSGGQQHGINIFLNKKIKNYQVNEGDSLLLAGTVLQRNGQISFSPIYLKLLSNISSEIAPKTVQSFSDSLESNLVTVKNLKLLTANGISDYELKGVTNANDTISIWVDSDTDIDEMFNKSRLLIGDSICSITGIVNQVDLVYPYTSDYRLLPIKSSDIDRVSCVKTDFLTSQKDTLEFSINHCNDVTRFNYSLQSLTDSSLKWLTLKQNDNIYDNFNNGISLFWNRNQGVDISSSCGTIDATNLLLFRGLKSDRFIESHPLNLRCYGNVEFSVSKGSVCSNNSADTSHSLRLQYSLNYGATWVHFNTINASGNYSIPLPISAQSELVKLRIIQNQATSANTEPWLLDNFKITPSINCVNRITLSQQSGTVNTNKQFNFSGNYEDYPLDSGITWTTIPIYYNDSVRGVRYLTLKLNYLKSFCPQFEFQNISCGASYEFTNTTIGDSLSYFWNFGDGDTSSAMSPFHFYDSIGIYTVTLKACNSFYCDSISREVIVSNMHGPLVPPCKPAFDANGSNQLQVSFIRVGGNTYLPNSKPIYDGRSSRDHTCENRTYLVINRPYTIQGSGFGFGAYSNHRYHAWIDYNNDGFFSANERIMATNNGTSGSSGFTVPTTAVLNIPLRLRMITYTSTSSWPDNFLVDCNSPINGTRIQRDITVVLLDSSLASPVANFKDSVLTCDTKISFISNTTNLSDTYFWDFGDGQTSTLALPTHEYAAYGTYSVKLVVSNPTGVDSITKSIVVAPRSVNTSIIGKQIPFCPIEFSVTSSTPIKNIVWDFGDGNTINGLRVAHPFINGGKYIVSSVVMDSSNCTYNLVDTLTILNLTDSIIACNSYTWIDGVTYTQSNNTATFAYSIDSLGCDSIRSLDLTINTPQYVNDTITACGSYTWPFNGLTYNSSTVISDTIMMNSCENYGSLQLSILPTNSRVDTINACNQYTWAQNNVNYTNSGIYQTNYTNQFGCDSSVYLNLTINQSTVNNSYINKCPGDSVLVFGVYQHQAGIYYDSLQTSKGCDSVIALTISFDSLDVTVGTASFTLVSNANNVKYQWLNCNQNYAVMSGDTLKSYTPWQIGSYAVEVSKDGCVDTSACIPVVVIGVNELELNNHLFEIVPNPTNGKFYIKTSDLDGKQNELLIYDINGSLHKRVIVHSNEQLIDVTGFSEGVYIIRYNQKSKRLIIRR